MSGSLLPDVTIKAEVQLFLLNIGKERTDITAPRELKLEERWGKPNILCYINIDRTSIITSP